MSQIAAEPALVIHVLSGNIAVRKSQGDLKVFCCCPWWIHVWLTSCEQSALASIFLLLFKLSVSFWRTHARRVTIVTIAFASNVREGSADHPTSHGIEILYWW